MNQEIKNEIYDDNLTSSKNKVFSYQENRSLNIINTSLRNRKQEKNGLCIQTGFDLLDEALGGGLMEGLYVCGAVPSLGKTTFMLQMCDQIAASGRDVMIISLEMSKIELAAKSISRHTAINSIKKYKSTLASKITKDVLAQLEYDDGSEDEIIDNAIKDYFSYADHVYIFEGVGDIGVKQIREMIKNHINITGKSPVVLIDYLQMLAPYNQYFGDKQNVDKNIIELKRISREFGIPVLTISSVNRENYKIPISMTSFKESGSIEYGADVLIGLQFQGAGKKEFNIEKAKKNDPRKIEVHILKNRNGESGIMYNYDYYAKYNLFCNYFF